MLIKPLTPKRDDDLYIMQAHTTGEIKVGRSNDVLRRLHQLQTGCPYTLRLILHAPRQGFREKAIHRLMDYRQIRRNGEWFTVEALCELPPELYGLLDLEQRDWWRT
jgi:hypothetical protein